MLGSRLTLILSLCVLNLTPPALAQAKNDETHRMRLLLNKRTLVVDANQPAYLNHAVEDLRTYLKEITGHDATTKTTLPKGKSPLLVIGSMGAAQVLGESSSLADLGDEGFVLKSVVKDGRDCLVVSGPGPKGSKFAVYELMKLIRADGKKAYLDGPVDKRSVPSFSVRGMHLNGWPFKHPYSFRSWREADWKRYADILSYQGVNLFYIWPFMEIIPLPLSKEDEEYLQEFRRVVDYAQREHGMQVWLMQSANRVATTNLNVADPRNRPYWRYDFQVDQNPGDPQQFQKIMDAREALYRIVNNVDGVCTIDSDPGGWKGSTIGEYIQILRGCRALLDKHNIHKSDTKLINWLWFGWGHTKPAFDVERQRQTIREFKRDLPEPWLLVAGYDALLPMCREEGVLPKTIFLRYGAIEDEPSYPGTQLGFNSIKRVFDVLKDYPEMAAGWGKSNGVMGNVQCPLVQFPNVFHFLNSAWDDNYRNRSRSNILMDLATQLHFENRQLLADCFAAIKEPNPDKVEALAGQLERLIESRKLGRPGVLARKIFPDHTSIARNLVLQLRFNAAQARFFRDVGSATTEADYRKLFESCLEAYLNWDNATGWHDLWGKNWGIAGTPFFREARLPRAIVALKQTLGSDETLNAFFDDMGSRLSQRHSEQSVNDHCLWFLKEIARTASATVITSLAQKATVTVSQEPNTQVYPASHANDGTLNTLYWPGALTDNNHEWIQLIWNSPQSFRQVKVYFLKHPSMIGRTIHLQKETAPGVWQDLATSVIKDEPKAHQAIATFELTPPVTLDKVRVVNLLDLYEIEIH